MATDIGELVISLAFESGDAKAEMKALVREVGNIDSSFKAMAAAAGGFGKGLDGAKLKAQSLTQQLEAQNRVVAQTGKELSGANQKLQQAQAKQAEYAAKVKTTADAHDKLGAELKETKSQWEAAKKAMGDNSDEANELGIKVLELEDAYKKSGAELKNLNKQHDQTSKSVNTAASDLQFYAGKESEAKAKAGELKSALEKTNKSIKEQSGLLNTVKMKEYSSQLNTTAQAQERFGRAMTLGVTLPIVGGLGAAVKEAVSWESAFAGVEKTVDGSAEELAKLNAELVAMSETVPPTRAELAAIAEQGGQFGLAIGSIADFSKTVADLKESTNLGDEGAAQLAKFQGITKMTEQEFRNAGSAVVDLGNDSKTTEKDIMAMAMRLAGAGTTVGMLPADILGVSAAFASMGIEAEAGGSSISKLLVDMQLAVETNSKALKEYAGVAQMTATEFAQAFKADAAGALASFISGLSTGGESAIKILDDIGISEVRMRDSLLRASNAGGLFAKSIKLSNDAWKANTALTNEANKRYQTFESRLKMAKNQALNVAMAFGEDMMPAMEGGLKVVTDLVKGFGDLNDATRGTALNVALAAASVGPLVSIVGAGNKTIANTIAGMAQFKTAVIDAGGGVKGLVSAVGGALGPMGVAALAAAVAYGAYAWYDYASGAKAAREATQSMIDTAKEWQSTQAQTIFDTGNNPFERFGIEKSDFGGGIDESKDWLARLKETWADGKKETSEIVNGYTDEFRDGSDKIRDAIKERKKIQAGLGAKDSANDEYLQQLDDMDKEVEKLLKKRKNGLLTEEDRARLNEIIQQRVQIQLEYTTGEGGGYEGIRQGVEAEKARLAAEAESRAALEGRTGGTYKPDVGADLYADALKAGAQGYQTQVDALNQSYRDQYAAVQAISDADERDAALKALNTQHQEALNKATSEYNGLVSEYAPEAYQSDEVQQAQKDVEALAQKIAAFNAGNLSLTELDEFTKTLDEGKLASYLTLLAQLQAGGLGDVNLSPEGSAPITAADLLSGYDTIGDFLASHAGTLPGLKDMFGAAGEEAMRVLVEMELSDGSKTLKEQLDDWQANGVEVAVNGSLQLTGLDQAALENWKKANPTIDLTGVNAEVGIQFGANWAADMEALWKSEKIKLYDGNGLPIEVDPSAPNPVTGNDLVVGMDEDGTYHVVVAPQVTGDPVKIEYYMEEIEKPGSLLTGGGAPIGDVKNLTERGNTILQSQNGIGSLWGLATGSQKHFMASDMAAMLDKTDVANLGAFVQETVAAINSGGEVSEEALANLQAIQDFVEMLQTIGIGEDIIAGIGQGMAEAGFDADATTVATNLQTAIDKALGINSPAKVMIPHGASVGEGIGLGMKMYGFAADAATAAANLKSGLAGVLNDLKTIGKGYGGDLMDGIDTGLEDKRNTVVSTARSIANEIKRTIREAWDINSPSKEGEWLSSMLMRGLEIPIERELPDIIGQLDQLEMRKNNVLAQAATTSRVTHVQNDNGVTVTGNTFTMSDKLDVRAFALELEGLRASQQRGLGRVYA